MSSTDSLSSDHFNIMAAPARIGTVRLRTRDISRVADFYQSVLGLSLLAEADSRVTLGAGATPLLDLTEDANLTVRDRRMAGLFHTAFLLPERGDLARWLDHATDLGVRLQGASDHGVSEAIYLADPEGNGIEIYADKPVSQWRSADGALIMPSDPLDVPGLKAAASGAVWKGMPERAIVGHLHLQVGAIAEAERFYGALPGFEVTYRYPGASFFGAGGYHHQIAANIWNSDGAGPAPTTMTGLDGFDLIVSSPVPAPTTGVGTVLHDPWGIAITMTGDGGANGAPENQRF